MTEKELRLNKLFSAVDAVLSLLIVIGILLHFTGVWAGALDVCVPLLGVSMIINAIRLYKSQRTISIIFFCAAVFILICCVGVFLI